MGISFAYRHIETYDWRWANEHDIQVGQRSNLFYKI